MAAWRGVVVAGLIASGLFAWACSSDETASPPTATPDGGGNTDANPSGDDAATDAGSKGTLGATCAVDADCEEGLACWNEAVGGRFPAHGLCSKKCADNTECNALAIGSVCMKLGATPSSGNWCAEPCTFGPGPLASLKSGPSPGKCHGRADFGCFNYGSPACVPSCNDDGECGPGAKCMAAIGLCSTTEQPAWDQIGTVPDDAGNCGVGLRRVPATPYTCSVLCTLGVVPTCNWDGGADASAACVFRAASQGAGDIGFCGKLCECNDQCEPGLSCAGLPASVQTETGRKGVCGGTGTAIPCADGGDGG